MNQELRDSNGEDGAGGGAAEEQKPFDWLDDDFEEEKTPAATEANTDDEPGGAASGADDEEEGKGDDAGDGTEGGKEKEFDTDSLVDSSETETAGTVTYDEKVLSSIAKDFDLLGEDGNASVKTIDELKSEFNKKLDASRKIVNLDEYHPEARMIVNLLEKGGSIDQIYTNDIISDAQSILAMSEGDKVLEMKIMTLEDIGYSPEKAASEAQLIVDGMSPETLKAEAEKIDTIARDSRQNEVKRIMDERKIYNDQVVERETKRVAAEKTSLLEAVAKTDSFLGITLGEKTKAMIIKSIEDGTFHNELKNSKAEALIDAFLMKTTGRKILLEHQKMIEKAGHKNMIEGMKKILAYLPKEGEQIRNDSSHQGGSDGDSKRFEWA